MNTVIITGADGFIGTHLSKYLTDHGYEVYAVVWSGSQTKDRIAGMDHVHMVEGDLNDYGKLIEKLPQKACAFIHLAWMGVTPDKRADLSFQMMNVEMAANAVKLASEVKAEKFLFPGSTMEYIHYGRPIDERAVPSPLNAYGAAKISARYACSILCRQLGVSFVYVVISGIYSEDRDDNNVIYYTIDKLLNREKPSLTRLEQLWDYIHIDDVVYGFRLIIEHGKDGAFYALGHGDNWPLSNYIYMIRDAIDPDLELGIGDVAYDNNEMPCSCVNLQPIFEDTGFVPGVSFEDGIKRVISEVRKRRSTKGNI
ncbi:MAG: NAD(P)-dependent oxidoreductase [Butyrivibrio sp.]|nr:NAD(P)-dependent oxidoreductase [Butyrivibrio sp.]